MPFDQGRAPLRLLLEYTPLRPNDRAAFSSSIMEAGSGPGSMPTVDEVRSWQKSTVDSHKLMVPMVR
eukprot:489074-Rhodomonas_salina.2